VKRRIGSSLPFGNKHPVVDIVLHGLVRDAYGREGSPPGGFLDNVVDVAQLGTVCEGGEAVGADDLVEEGAGFLEDGGVLHDVEEGDGGGCEGLGGVLVLGQ